MREMGVDLAELAPEARDLLSAHLGFDVRDEKQVARKRGRVEETVEQAFHRGPGFADLPRPLGRQLFAAGLESSPDRAADLLVGALIDAGARPRKRRRTPGQSSVRRTLTPEIAQAVRKAEGEGRLGQVREEFALRAFQDMAGRARTDQRVTRRLDGALGRTLQALHNDLGYVMGGRAAPLALDGVAGPGTRDGFDRALATIGPGRMARDIAERLRAT
jgi:hypothetical protein